MTTETMADFIERQMTESQRAAVMHRDGPLLILAGPGSGKTRVVTYRIAYLLEQGVGAEQLLALTFTNKASQEMQERVHALAPGAKVWVSTFHRFCSKLLRRYARLVGLSENFTIYDAHESERALKHVLSDHPQLNHQPKSSGQLLAEISRLKNQLLTPEMLELQAEGKRADPILEVYRSYQSQLLRSNAVDFDDLLLHVVHLLRSQESLRQDLDHQFQFVMVDEYQDTNLAQYAIARSLSRDVPNLAVTGDPDQSIYTWRGATIRNILEFEHDYPQVHVVRLEENFRSTPEISHVADTLIHYNRHRKAKALIATRDSGERVRLKSFPTQAEEAQYIAEEISRLVSSGERTFQDFAILYRMNSLSRYLEHALHEHSVPYQILKGVEFYQRKEIKDVMGYLQLLNNPRDDMAFLRVINTPPRGLGKVTIQRLTAHANKSGLSLLQSASDPRMAMHVAKRPVKALKEFAQMIDSLNRYATSPVEEILGHILNVTDYERYLADQPGDDDDPNANIRELLSAARQFDARHTGTDYLEAFLEQSALTSDTDAFDAHQQRVALMTLHAAKGLEFSVVYLVAVEQGKLPHDRAIDSPEQLEEERRLMFVGITRARDLLTISYANQRDFKGQTKPTIPSPFLSELPGDDMDVVLAPRMNRWNPEWSAQADDALDDSFGDSPFPEETYVPEATDFDPMLFADADQSVEIDDREASDWNLSAKPLSASLPPLVTAASLSSHSANESERRERVDPNAFVHGMRVSHPDYGLGKIVALSGTGKRRQATINFALVGQKTIILYNSALRPLSS